jgi:hypothetical protein
VKRGDCTEEKRERRQGARGRSMSRDLVRCQQNSAASQCRETRCAMRAVKGKRVSAHEKSEQVSGRECIAGGLRVSWMNLPWALTTICLAAGVPYRSSA